MPSVATVRRICGLPAMAMVSVCAGNTGSGPSTNSMFSERSVCAVPPDSTEIHARGRCCYVAPNRTAEGRARNRRVEITVLAEGVE